MSKRLDILTEWQEIVGAGIQLPENQPFLVPEGYFDTLTLRLIKHLLAQGQAVPDGYFENLPKRLAIKTGSLQNQTQVPDGYFDRLPNAILGKIKQQATETELDEIAPTLASIAKKMPYEVPQGYFDKVVLTKEVAQKPKGMVVPFYKKLRTYVAAASVLFVLSMSGYLLLKPAAVQPTKPDIVKNETIQPVTPTVKDEQAVVMPVKAIVTEEAFKKALEEVDEKELTAFVDNHAATANFAETLFENKLILEETIKEDIDEVIEEVSDEELNNYLNGGS
jgi:hypothetical protein